MADVIGSLLILGVGVVVLVSLTAGAVVGWHLRGLRAGPLETPPDPRTGDAPASEDLKASLDAEKIKELLGQLKRLTDRASSGMGEHSTRVEKISREIAARCSGADPLEHAVLGAAQQLLQANEQLRAELDAAKGQMQNHAQQIEAHMAEARTDGLCGVANRRAFDEELQRRFEALEREGKPFSLILLDVDHFKRFNDQHGHQAGDEVLRAAGRVLSENVRDCDIVTRYGGEEFAVIVPECSFLEAQVIAERLRISLAEQRIVHEGKTLRVTASLGVAEARAGQNPGAVVQHADQALYAAKQNGRNCTYFFNGQTCEQFDAAWFESNRDMLEAVQQQLDEEQRTGAPIDRRGQPRRPFPTNQFIAPYLNGQIPTRDMFQQVLCHDISSGGFSFLLPQPPRFDSIIVALGMPPNVTYLTGRIVHTSASSPNGQSMYLVGCRFMGRIELNIECADARLEAATV
ncbi:MAG TPA: GGDEF domain-containing protein [Pirellulales bacterium]|nr:GGDEF domain-containing protein [Pirellulales bacterium]